MVKPAIFSASARLRGVPRPAVSGRSRDLGSVSTRSILTEPIPKKRSIDERASGTAIAIPTPTTATASARASQRRVRTRRSSRSRTARLRFGVTGYSSSCPSARSACSSSVIALPQPFQGTRRARLDRSLCDPERLGHLVLAEAGEVPEGDDHALVVRKVVDGGEQLGSPLAVEQRSLGGRGRVPRGLCSGGAEREARATARRAATVVRLVRDDPEEPRPERRSRTKPAERAPCFDEAVLRGVLGLGRAS